MHPHKLHKQNEYANHKGHAQQSEKVFEQIAIYFFYKTQNNSIDYDLIKYAISFPNYPHRNLEEANQQPFQRYSKCLLRIEPLALAVHIDVLFPP